jgi:hypothetical protein
MRYELSDYEWTAIKPMLAYSVANVFSDLASRPPSMSSTCPVIRNGLTSQM